MLEQVVRQARHARQEGGVRGGDTLDSEGVERRHVMRPCLCNLVETLFSFPPHIGEHRHAAFAEPALGEKSGDLGRGLLVGCQDQQPGVGLDEGDHLLDRAAVDGERFNVDHRPAHARGGELEGGELRVIGNLGGIEGTADAFANREPERVTSSQHDDTLSSQRPERRDQRVERRGPFDPFGVESIR